jgi:hypothetical protein
MNRDLPLEEGYYIFNVVCKEEGGPEIVARMLTIKVREAQKEWDVEFISNAKIDADSGGHGRSIYFGMQCVNLSKKKRTDEVKLPSSAVKIK